jgi:prevent-host-death family protein
MRIINTHEAKTHLSRLLERVEAGEDIVIGRAGVPIARLTAYREPAEPRTGGQWKGLVRTGDDFDDSLPPDMQRAFEPGS